LNSFRLRIRRDADAVVLDAKLDAAAVAPHAQVNAAAVVGVLRGVVEQVAENLYQAREVAAHHQRAVGAIDRQLVAMLGDHRLQRLDRARDDRLAAHRLLRQPDRAARDARDVEQIVDQPRQVHRLPIDDVARPFQLRVLERKRDMISTALRIGASGLRSSCARIARNSSL
jgi:hypothetical protein